MSLTNALGMAHDTPAAGRRPACKHRAAAVGRHGSVGAALGGGN